MADFLAALAAAGQAPTGLADRLPPHRHVRHESDPHLWTAVEIRRLLAGIDRQSATGERDYAMILTTTRLGLRVSDLRGLELGEWTGGRKQTRGVSQHGRHHRDRVPPVPVVPCDGVPNQPVNPA